MTTDHALRTHKHTTNAAPRGPCKVGPKSSGRPTVRSRDLQPSAQMYAHNCMFFIVHCLVFEQKKVDGITSAQLVSLILSILGVLCTCGVLHSCFVVGTYNFWSIFYQFWLRRKEKQKAEGKEDKKYSRKHPSVRLNIVSCRNCCTTCCGCLAKAFCCLMSPCCMPSKNTTLKKLERNFEKYNLLSQAFDFAPTRKSSLCCFVPSCLCNDVSVAATIIAFQAKSFFSGVSGANCSDASTNHDLSVRLSCLSTCLSVSFSSLILLF